MPPIFHCPLDPAGRSTLFLKGASIRSHGRRNAPPKDFPKGSNDNSSRQRAVTIVPENNTVRWSLFKPQASVRIPTASIPTFINLSQAARTTPGRVCAAPLAAFAPGYYCHPIRSVFAPERKRLQTPLKVPHWRKTDFIRKFLHTQRGTEYRFSRDAPAVKRKAGNRIGLHPTIRLQPRVWVLSMRPSTEKEPPP